MKAKIVFGAAVSLAVLAVILLALFSPSSHTNQPKNSKTLSLSLYLQQSLPIGTSSPQPVGRLHAGAIIFHRALTERPTNTSRHVGKAQGFIIPIERFAHSAFNIIHLSFDTAEHSGSLNIRVDNVVAGRGSKEELKVVGGTGCFAFARGLAVFAPADRDHPDNVDATHSVELQLNFPNRSKTR